MTLTSIQSELLIQELQKAWSGLHLFNRPYFSSLLSGKMKKGAFILSQQAFYHAVSYFSKPMCLLASRIDSAHARMQIIENLYEEHGEMKMEAFHESTFKQWLQELSPGAEENLPLVPCVDSFNSTLLGICQGAPVEKGVCSLGTIEYMFSNISKYIAETTVQLQWISRKNLVHYDLHADLDIKHSRDFFEIIDKLQQPNMASCIEGIHLGIFMFSRLYDDLHDLH